MFNMKSLFAVALVSIMSVAGYAFAATATKDAVATTATKDATGAEMHDEKAEGHAHEHDAAAEAKK